MNNIANAIIPAGTAGNRTVKQRLIVENPNPSRQCVTLPMPPSLNNAYINRGRKRILSPVARAYKQHAAAIAIGAGIVQVNSPVILRADFYRPRRAGDLDNMNKICIDALKGIAWIDDSQIIEIHSRRFDDKANPRVELTIEARTE